MLPIGPLMIEHRLIEQLIAILDEHVKKSTDIKQIDLSLIDQGVDFLRRYADRCHHGKEEDIFFQALQTKELHSAHKNILDELVHEHSLAREAVKNLALASEKAAAGDANGYADIVKMVEKIAALYPPHIEKEDKHFFIPVMDYFSKSEQDDMMLKFLEADQKLLYENYYLIVNGLEEIKPMVTVEAEKTAVNTDIYECSVCGFLYDPVVGDPQHGIPAGTPFDELPADWVCPLCGAVKDMFDKQEKTVVIPAPSEIKPQKTVKEYRSNDIIVYWYPQDCSHAGKCWQGLPSVFDMDKRPWVNISGSSAEEIIQTIDKCPSRALQYSLPEGSAVDPELTKGPGSKDYKIDPARAGKIRVIKEGPLLIEGPNQIIDINKEIIGEGDRFVLCRCGKTQNPPFCDGRHIPGH